MTSSTRPQRLRHDSIDLKIPDEKGEESWDSHGNKVHYHREQSVDFSCPNRYPRDCCTLSRCVGGCSCVSAETGSPIVRTSSCSSSRATIRWPISRRATFLQTPSKGPSIRATIPILGSPPGIPSRRASRARPGEHGDTSNCPRTQASYRHGLRLPGPRWMG